MREAKKRNPRIYLDILQWGAPGWIGETAMPDNPAAATMPWDKAYAHYSRKFYTQDNADFIVGFINGARAISRRGHGLTAASGTRSTTTPNGSSSCARRSTPTRCEHVKIVASDQCGRHPWEIAKPMLADRALSDAIYAIGVHYPGMFQKDDKVDDRFKASPRGHEDRQAAVVERGWPVARRLEGRRAPWPASTTATTSSAR